MNYINSNNKKVMERKIGEIFEYNGEYYQVVECSKDNYPCIGCCGCKGVGGPRINGGECNGNAREDNKFVIFKKLEKVGEPYNIGKKVFQRYEVFTKPYIFNDEFFTINTPVDDSFISIEIKRNEDMEECNNTNLSNSENIGKNLKPFSLEAAKAGKPVCTKDGRKARIISCSLRNKNFPIAAIVEDEEENVYQFEANGVCDEHNENLDLMMLPEKKEGWVNLYRDEESKRVYCGEFIFSEREKAEKHYECNDTKVATVPIRWEE